MACAALLTTLAAGASAAAPVVVSLDNADDVATLFINGRRIFQVEFGLHGPIFKVSGVDTSTTPIGNQPGSSGPVDVTRFLRQGENVLRILLENKAYPGGWASLDALVRQGEKEIFSRSLKNADPDASTPLDVTLRIRFPEEEPSPTVQGNIAPLSSLHRRLVDGIKAAPGVNCVNESSFGPGWNPGESIVAEFDRMATITGVGLYLGEQDHGELGSGIVERREDGGGWVRVLTFSNVGLRNRNEVLRFPAAVSTNALRITMTGGGGPDSNLCVREIEIEGRLGVEVEDAEETAASGIDLELIRLIGLSGQGADERVLLLNHSAEDATDIDFDLEVGSDLVGVHPSVSFCPAEGTCVPCEVEAPTPSALTVTCLQRRLRGGEEMVLRIALDPGESGSVAPTSSSLGGNPQECSDEAFSGGLRLTARAIETDEDSTNNSVVLPFAGFERDPSVLGLRLALLRADVAGVLREASEVSFSEPFWVEARLEDPKASCLPSEITVDLEGEVPALGVKAYRYSLLLLPERSPTDRAPRVFRSDPLLHLKLAASFESGWTNLPNRRLVMEMLPRQELLEGWFHTPNRVTIAYGTVSKSVNVVPLRRVTFRLDPIPAGGFFGESRTIPFESYAVLTVEDPEGLLRTRSSSVNAQATGAEAFLWTSPDRGLLLEGRTPNTSPRRNLHVSLHGAGDGLYTSGPIRVATDAREEDGMVLGFVPGGTPEEAGADRLKLVRRGEPVEFGISFEAPVFSPGGAAPQRWQAVPGALAVRQAFRLVATRKPDLEEPPTVRILGQRGSIALGSARLPTRLEATRGDEQRYLTDPLVAAPGSTLGDLRAGDTLCASVVEREESAGDEAIVGDTRCVTIEAMSLDDVRLAIEPLAREGAGPGAGEAGARSSGALVANETVRVSVEGTAGAAVLESVDVDLEFVGRSGRRALGPITLSRASAAKSRFTSEAFALDRARVGGAIATGDRLEVRYPAGAATAEAELAVPIEVPDPRATLVSLVAERSDGSSSDREIDFSGLLIASVEFESEPQDDTLRVAFVAVRDTAEVGRWEANIARLEGSLTRYRSSPIALASAPVSGQIRPGDRIEGRFEGGRENGTTSNALTIVGRPGAVASIRFVYLDDDYCPDCDDIPTRYAGGPLWVPAGESVPIGRAIAVEVDFEVEPERKASFIDIVASGLAYEGGRLRRLLRPVASSEGGFATFRSDVVDTGASTPRLLPGMSLSANLNGREITIRLREGLLDDSLARLTVVAKDSFGHALPTRFRLRSLDFPTNTPVDVAPSSDGPEEVDVVYPADFRHMVTLTAGASTEVEVPWEELGRLEIGLKDSRGDVRAVRQVRGRRTDGSSDPGWREYFSAGGTRLQLPQGKYSIDVEFTEPWFAEKSGLSARRTFDDVAIRAGTTTKLEEAEALGRLRVEVLDFEGIPVPADVRVVAASTTNLRTPATLEVPAGVPVVLEATMGATAARRTVTARAGEEIPITFSGPGRLTVLARDFGGAEVSGWASLRREGERGIHMIRRGQVTDVPPGSYVVAFEDEPRETQGVEIESGRSSVVERSPLAQIEFKDAAWSGDAGYYVFGMSSEVRAGQPIAVLPGRYVARIRAELPSDAGPYFVAQQTFGVEGGERLVVRFPEPAVLELQWSSPSASSLLARSLGSSWQHLLNARGGGAKFRLILPAGPYELSWRTRDGKDLSRVVTLTSGATTGIDLGEM